MADSGTEKEMGGISRIIGIFTSPRDTFASIDRKPTWLVPFIILVVGVVVMILLTQDIGIQDRIAQMEARGVPQEQMDVVQSRMQGGAKYIGLVAAPIFMLISWTVIAGILLFGGNTMMGGASTFKKMFALVSWSSLIGMIALIIKTVLIVVKGTSSGVTTSLAAFLPIPSLGSAQSVLYRLLSKFDIFTIWEMILWIVGISVMYRFTTKKSAILVGIIWGCWVVVSVALGGLFANLGM